MASGVHAANRATGSRTSPFKSSAFICHPWFLPTIHIPNHGPPGVDGRLEDESLLFPIRTEKNETGTRGGAHQRRNQLCRREPWWFEERAHPTSSLILIKHLGGWSRLLVAPSKRQASYNNSLVLPRLRRRSEAAERSEGGGRGGCLTSAFCKASSRLLLKVGQDMFCVPFRVTHFTNFIPPPTAFVFLPPPPPPPPSARLLPKGLTPGHQQLLNQFST
ncbi:unnamed protein product [Pleuronectes platessa]|uniref:Uncharacterized protein n=1 Tax=Pleuronectes platessa TaxID=8262 RepID=A0A9N7VV27_PLEPL|nr:unnamed protein product [Pleuronectes platessa]